MTSSDTLPLSEDQQELQETLRGFLAGQLPPATLRAALETRAGYSPELHARLTILNEKNEVVARLGDDVARVTGKDGGAIRDDSKKWLTGKFVHPHDACFAHDGSIYIAEWVATGRVTKLKRV